MFVVFCFLVIYAVQILVYIVCVFVIVAASVGVVDCLEVGQWLTSRLAAREVVSSTVPCSSCPVRHDGLNS